MTRSASPTPWPGLTSAVPAFSPSCGGCRRPATGGLSAADGAFSPTLSSPPTRNWRASSPTTRGVLVDPLGPFSFSLSEEAPHASSHHVHPGLAARAGPGAGLAQPDHRAAGGRGL